MEKTNCMDDEMSPELLHAYAKNDGSCPNTWSRESEEWQFDGIAAKDAEPLDTPSTESCQDLTSAKNSLTVTVSRQTPLQTELSKWLPAT